MVMSDKELKKIKAMMPSGASLQAIKNLIKGQRERNKADRHPPKSKKKLPRTKRSMGPAGASTVSKDGKRMKKR